MSKGYVVVPDDPEKETKRFQTWQQALVYIEELNWKCWYEYEEG